jgi:hypothetical protein
MAAPCNKDNIVPYCKGMWVWPVAVAERSEAWAVFGRSEAVIAGSDPALGMDV